jgi:hypothetical protein
MEVSFGVAVVDPGLLHIKGETKPAIADVLNPTSRVSETSSDRILIRLFLRETKPTRHERTSPETQRAAKNSTESVPVVSTINMLVSSIKPFV